METKPSKKKIIKPQISSVVHSKPGSTGNFQLMLPSDKSAVIDRIKSFSSKQEKLGVTEGAQ